MDRGGHRSAVPGARKDDFSRFGSARSFEVRAPARLLADAVGAVANCSQPGARLKALGARRCGSLANTLYEARGSALPEPNRKGACMTKIFDTLQGTIIAGIVIAIVVDIIVRYSF